MVGATMAGTVGDTMAGTGDTMAVMVGDTVVTVGATVDCISDFDLSASHTPPAVR